MKAVDESDLSAPPQTKCQSRPNPKYLQSQASESEYELSASEEEDEPVSQRKIKLMIKKKRRDLLQMSPPRNPSMNIGMNMKKEVKRETNSCHKICFYKNSSLWQAVRTPLRLSSTSDDFTSKVFTFIHQL